MLRLSRLTDYGMVVMAALAGLPYRTQSAGDIAAKTRIGAPTVRKLLKRLGRAGLVNSARGVNGGYRLALSAEHISVAQVIAALEGPIGLTECSRHNGHCSIESDCRLRGNWQVINSAVRDALAGVSLAEMAAPMADFELRPVTIAARTAVPEHDFSAR